MLPFRKLEPGSWPPLAVLFSLFNPRIPFDEAGSLQRQAKIGIGCNERPGDGVSNRTGLAGNTAADHSGDDIIRPECIGQFERLNHLFTGDFNRKIILCRAPVDGNFTGARLYPRPGNRCLPSSGCIVNVFLLHLIHQNFVVPGF